MEMVGFKVGKLLGLKFEKC